MLHSVAFPGSWMRLLRAEALEGQLDAPADRRRKNSRASLRSLRPGQSRPSTSRDALASLGDL